MQQKIETQHMSWGQGCSSLLLSTPFHSGVTPCPLQLTLLLLCTVLDIWSSNLLCEIGFDIPVSHFYDDNLGSLFWSTNPVQEKRSKHIDIRYHYVRDVIEDDKIKPYHIDGARNPADILTKNLGQILFHQFHPLLGLEILWTLLLIYIVTQWLLLWVRGSVKLNNYCTVYYCSLIYKPCLHKRGLLLCLNCCVTEPLCFSWDLSSLSGCLSISVG